jgi:hypothetical protein
METQDGSEPDSTIVDEIAKALADRVAAVLAGSEVSGVVYGLPSEVIQFDMPPQVEGYQTVEEAFVIDDPRFPVGDYVSGYYRGASYSESVRSVLPYVTIGVNQFTTAKVAREAILPPDALIPSFDNLEEIRNMEIAGAGIVRAYGFSSPQGTGSPDSVRLFMLVDDKLISIDVQGMESLDEAEAAARELAELQLACTVDGNCDSPGTLD